MDEKAHSTYPMTERMFNVISPTVHFCFFLWSESRIKSIALKRKKIEMNWIDKHTEFNSTEFENWHRSAIKNSMMKI